MKIKWPKAGKYVMAVSGGVDSVILLHLLATKKEKKYDLVVAYADHGWRDGTRDRELVEKIATTYGLPFETLKLSKTTSEAGAREARHEFLERVRLHHNADAIITAHHADDRVETVVLNLLRGTGRRGLSSLQSTDLLVRPLLEVAKSDIITYARRHKLAWLEDETNADTRYLRNYVRLELLPRLREDNPQIDNEIITLSDEAKGLNTEIDTELANWVKTHTMSVESGVELSIPDLCRHSLAGMQEIIIYAAQVLVPHIELDARAVAELALHVKTGRVHKLRKLHVRLFVERRYDTLAITVSHL